LLQASFNINRNLYRILAVAFTLLGIPICIAGILSFRSNMEDVFQWLPDTSHERDVYNSFTNEFGADDFVVVYWADCKLQDPRLNRYSNAVREQDTQGLVRQCISGEELLTTLQEKSGLRRSQVLKRFDGFYFGHEQHSCVVVSLTHFGMDHRKEATRFLKDIATSTLSIAEDDLWIAGYPVVGAYGDQLIIDSIKYLVGPSCLISTIIAWICLRSLFLTLSVLAISGFATALSVSALTLSGAQWGGLSSVIPTLAYLMTVSGALHLINYAQGCPGKRLAREVLAIGWRPCLFSAMTTAIGMLSLCRSEFPAVRHFGFFCATGVLISAACQLLLIPNAIEVLQNSISKSKPRVWQDRIFGIVAGHRRNLVIGFVVATAVFGFGLTKLEANLEVERAFRANTTLMQNIAKLESTLGPIEQTELVVSFENPSDRGIVERLLLIREIQSRTKQIPVVRGALSLADSLPSPPTTSGVGATLARAGFRNLLHRQVERLEDTAYLAKSPSRESWRISIRVPFMESTDFRQLEQQIREVADETIRQSTFSKQASLRYTGVSHLYYIAQESVISDLYRNFTLAFCVITPLLMLAFRSWSMGLLAMLPNLFPTILVFGVIGLIGYPIDIGIAMTASVALGIAVDDTTHFLVRFRELAGKDRRSFGAMQLAYRQCSRAMLHTTLIAGLALSVYIGGPLVAMTRFAILLISLLFVALLCDLLLLPSLLITCQLVDPPEATTTTRRSAQGEGRVPCLTGLLIWSR